MAREKGPGLKKTLPRGSNDDMLDELRGRPKRTSKASLRLKRRNKGEVKLADRIDHDPGFWPATSLD